MIREATKKKNSQRGKKEVKGANKQKGGKGGVRRKCN